MLVFRTVSDDTPHAAGRSSQSQPFIVLHIDGTYQFGTQL
jgi:hypothetical protein